MQIRLCAWLLESSGHCRPETALSSRGDTLPRSHPHSIDLDKRTTSGRGLWTNELMAWPALDVAVWRVTGQEPRPHGWDKHDKNASRHVTGAVDTVVPALGRIHTGLLTIKSAGQRHQSSMFFSVCQVVYRCDCRNECLFLVSSWRNTLHNYYSWW